MLGSEVFRHAAKNPKPESRPAATERQRGENPKEGRIPKAEDRGCSRGNRLIDGSHEAAILFLYVFWRG
jgi:hypothetical protein